MPHFQGRHQPIHMADPAAIFEPSRFGLRFLGIIARRGDTNCFQEEPWAEIAKICPFAARWDWSQGGQGKLRVEVKMPFLEDGTETVSLIRWLVETGAAIGIDQDLAEMSVNGRPFLLPSPLDGRIVELCVEPGSLIATDEVLAVVEED